MDLFSDLMVFAKVVEAGSFTGAADQLGLAKSSVSKKVSALEIEYGVRLIQRTTRQLSITEEGMQLYDRCLRLRDELATAKIQLTEFSGKLQGRLRVSAPPLFSQICLSPHLHEFLLAYPDLELDLQLNDEYSELVDEGYDVLIRTGEQADSSLICQRLTSIQPRVVASPGYLKNRGIPKKPDDLLDHNCLIWQRAGSAKRSLWPFLRGKTQYSVNVSGNFIGNDLNALKQAVIGGVGIAILPDYMLANELSEGGVVEVLPGYQQRAIPIYLVYAHRKQMTAKQRVFIDFVKSIIAR